MLVLDITKGKGVLRSHVSLEDASFGSSSTGSICLAINLSPGSIGVDVFAQGLPVELQSA